MNAVTLNKLDRRSITPVSYPVKVLQFGEGNFLRAFADWIVDVMNEKTAFGGMVRIVQPLAAGMGDVINDQEGLYHVLLNGIEEGTLTRQTRLIRGVQGVTNPYVDFQTYLALGENPDLKFVISNTTEAGITFSPEDTNPREVSKSFPGKLTSLLYHRFSFFNGSPESGLVFLPCELIDKNGEQLRTTVLAYAKHWGLPEGFKTWLLDHNTFCNTLVDRIVPGFPADTIDEIQRETGYADRLVVKAEPFHLWVIEGPENVRDIFPAEKAGLQVKVVSDLGPYRTRKVRILNGAHTAMVPVAYLKGLRTVQETVEDPDMGEFVKRAIFNEIIPTLDLPAEELKSFATSVLDRFRNPYIRHELITIALNSVSKFKVRVLPSLLEYYHRKQELPPLLTRSLAALILFYKGHYNGTPVPVNDTPDVISFFNNAWDTGRVEDVVSTVLSNVSFWDVDLTGVPGLREATVALVKQLSS